MKKTISYFLVMLLTVLSSAAGAASRDDAMAKVTVYKQVNKSAAIYTYTVTNTGNRPITGFEMGYDYRHGVPELSGAFPTITSPVGWTGYVVTMEESDKFDVNWRSNTIPPGQTVTGFSLTVPQENATYLSSHWTVAFHDNPMYASSLVQKRATPADAPSP